MKWANATVQRNEEVTQFIQGHLKKSGRRCALICGAGFDPRTLGLPKALRASIGADIAVLCLREERIKPQPGLRPIADEHSRALKEFFPGAMIEVLEIFDSEGSVVAGRRVLTLVNAFLTSAQESQPLTDLLIDISALSCGVFFPIFALLQERANTTDLGWNIHLFVTEAPQIDFHIRGELTDTVSHIHGFRSPDSLSQTSDHAMLWVPVLAEHKDAEMRLIHGHINQPAATVDIFPIVPFPGQNPRTPDLLVERFRDLFREWEVDPRHLLYAAESDPLDAYRSICQIDKRRSEIYGQLGGSSTIISPLGSKMLSVGQMLAAIERKLRVIYVESIGYEEIAVPLASHPLCEQAEMTHLWLHGESYSAWQ